jgi:uncharacterized protein YidB (DUF937 family)
MSGLLGQLIGDMLRGQSGSQPSAITGIIQQIVASGSGGAGGVSALVSRFEAVGLGQQAQSWVANGPNQAISSDQLGQVFSADEVQAWAQQAGTTPDAILKVLSEALPKAVDHVTPTGQPPAQAADLEGMLQNFFGAHGLAAGTEPGQRAGA